ncbi:Leucine Rich repeat family protein [Leishmania donovani]|uniref:Leucine Rich repeat family protein n=1 Tax=Leishmania donovani TaxID=5661 RepID=A0A504X387_LEIDO|nr:Leucine Rich repeat family protein [Leishmania donovani]
MQFLERTASKPPATFFQLKGVPTQVAGELTASFQRRFHRFDAAIVCSKANRSLWPPHFGAVTPCDEDSVLTGRVAVCLDITAMGQTPINAAELAIPSDGIDAFLSLMARRSAESNGRFASDSVTKLVALPSADTVASLSEIIGSLVSSKPVMERLSGLVACGASAATADDVLAEFLSSATKLEELCLVNCTLENTVTALMEAVKNTEMKRLGLERSDLGIGSADSDCEGLTTSFCEALKVNKFLTSLNLSNTNLDTTFVVALIDALLESDTKLLPEDLGEDAEEVTGWSLEGRLDKAAFVSGGGRDDSNASLTDDETARRLRERQEKEEWQARQERIRQELKALLQSEVRERSDLAHEYYQGLQDVVAINNAPIANLRATERQQKKEAYCSRRSGWSRLETLVLRGNQVGDRGCRKLASLLRDEVPLSEEEVVQRQEAIDAIRGSFGERLGAARRAVERREKRAWRELLRKAQKESPDFAIDRRTSISAALSDLDEEDEYAKEAPPVLLTNVERSPSSSSVDESPASDGDGDTEASSGFNPEEQREWQEWVAQALPHMPVALTKKGMNTIRVIDLGSCGISRKGVKTLAEVLKTNKVLETLCLRHNPIGSSAPAKKHAQPEDGLTIFPEFAEFAEMLSVNGALCHLDMGYCHLSPDDVRAVAGALRNNTSMVTLSLEGNQLGVDEGYQQQTHAHSYIYELWMTAARPGSALRNLNMDHNHIATCLWQEEVAALAAVCGQLTSLSLSHVGLRLRHLEAWSEALPPEDPSYSPAVRVLHLARNELATEADGAALGLLLRHFTALEELSVEEHPLLGSSGVAAALEYLPATMRRLNCTATGLTTPRVGAAQNPVLPVAVVEQLTCLLLGDVEAPTVTALGEWVDFVKRAAPRQLQFLSLWTRGMAGKEADVMPLQLELAQTCPSLLHVDSGFQPEFHASTFASNCFEQMERLLFPRRMRCAAEQSKV